MLYISLNVENPDDFSLPSLELVLGEEALDDVEGEQRSAAERVIFLTLRRTT